MREYNKILCKEIDENSKEYKKEYEDIKTFDIVS
jgi:hypothetical protein